MPPTDDEALRADHDLSGFEIVSNNNTPCTHYLLLPRSKKCERQDVRYYLTAAMCTGSVKDEPYRKSIIVGRPWKRKLS